MTASGNCGGLFEARRTTFQKYAAQDGRVFDRGKLRLGIGHTSFNMPTIKTDHDLPQRPVRLGACICRLRLFAYERMGSRCSRDSARTIFWVQHRSCGFEYVSAHSPLFGFCSCRPTPCGGGGQGASYKGPASRRYIPRPVPPPHVPPFLLLTIRDRSELIDFFAN